MVTALMHTAPIFGLVVGFAIRGLALDPDDLNEWQTKMQPLSPRGYVCRHTDTPIAIDGTMDDAAWAGAEWTEDFVDIEGPAKPKPRFKTRAKMLWDDEFLYVAADLEETDVWGTRTEHDSVIFQDPDFEVFIDPDGDSHDYFEFEINALNTGWDLFLPKPYKDGGKADNTWEIPGLKTAVDGVRGTINDATDRDGGWTVELAFPWHALATKVNRATPPRDGAQWRMGFSRVEWQIERHAGKYLKVPNHPENNWVWSPQGVIDMHRPERWGYVQFTHDAAVKFTPDPAAPVRDKLQEIYYAQRAFRKAHGGWAKTTEDLALPGVGGITMRVTPGGWKVRPSAGSAMEYPGGCTLLVRKLTYEKLFLSIGAVLGFASSLCGEQPPRWWSDSTEAALVQAGSNRPELTKALIEVPGEQREGMEFLVTNMPAVDLTALTGSYLLENVRLAYESFAAAPWATKSHTRSS